MAVTDDCPVMRSAIVIAVVMATAAGAGAEPRTWRAPLDWDRERGATFELEAGYGAGVMMRPTHSGGFDAAAGAGPIVNLGIGLFGSPQFTYELRLTSLTDRDGPRSLTVGLVGFAMRVSFGPRFSLPPQVGLAVGLGYSYSRGGPDHLMLGALGEVRISYPVARDRNAWTATVLASFGPLSGGPYTMIGAAFGYQRL